MRPVLLYGSNMRFINFILKKKSDLQLDDAVDLLPDITFQSKVSMS